MVEFNVSILSRNLVLLSRNRQLAFILLLCERLMPPLDKFSRNTDFNGTVYRRSLEEGWCSLARGGNSSNFKEISEECLEQAPPDTEKFDHPLTSAALNACLSVRLLMNFLSDLNVTHLVEVANLAIDTVALDAQSSEASPSISLGFQEVMQHRYVQEELRRQQEDLRFVASLPSDVAGDIFPLVAERATRNPD